MSTKNQIHLKGEFRREEKTAAAEITPGHLLEIDSDSKVLVHATEGGWASLTFAEIDALQGEVLTDAYAADALVACNVELPGNHIQAFLQAGEDVAIGEKLISGGDGTLIAYGSEDSSTTVRQIIAVALEALDLSGSGAVDTLIEVHLMP